MPNEYSDVIFVCIGFEGRELIESHAGTGSMGRKKQAQAGVSIFDTRILSSPLPQEALRTYNIGLGGSSSNKRRIHRRFLFGQTNWIRRLGDLLESIEKLVDRTRNIVLVGHGFIADVRALQSLGCPVEGCYIAGNDANFTLRPLLLLAAESYSGFEDSMDDNARERFQVYHRLLLVSPVSLRASRVECLGET